MLTKDSSTSAISIYQEGWSHLFPWKSRRIASPLLFNIYDNPSHSYNSTTIHSSSSVTPSIWCKFHCEIKMSHTSPTISGVWRSLQCVLPHWHKNHKWTCGHTCFNESYKWTTSNGSSQQSSHSLNSTIIVYGWKNVTSLMIHLDSHTCFAKFHKGTTPIGSLQHTLNSLSITPIMNNPSIIL